MSRLPFKGGLIDYDNVKQDENAAKFHVHPCQHREMVFYDFDKSKRVDADALWRVNANLWQAFERRKQRLHEIHFKRRIWRMLSDALKPAFPTAHLALGGSTVNRFGTRGSDLDLCLAIRCGVTDVYDELVSSHVLSVAKTVLESKRFVHSVIMVAARVPILKVQLKFPYNDIDIDINCNCVAGIFNSHLLRYYAAVDPRVPAMTTYLKDWGAETHVVDPKFGGVNSYTIMLMVVHFLQCAVDPPILPNLVALYPQMFDGSGNVENLVYNATLDIPQIPKNDRSLAELMYGFLNYYEQFDYENAGISIREAKLFDRRCRPLEDSRFLFFIEEAYDGLTVPKNLIRQSKLDSIRRCFQEARDNLLHDIIGGIPSHLTAYMEREYGDGEEEDDCDYYDRNAHRAGVAIPSGSQRNRAGEAPWMTVRW